MKLKSTCKCEPTSAHPPHNAWYDTNTFAPFRITQVMNTTIKFKTITIITFFHRQTNIWYENQSERLRQKKKQIHKKKVLPQNFSIVKKFSLYLCLFVPFFLLSIIAFYLAFDAVPVSLFSFYGCVSVFRVVFFSFVQWPFLSRNSNENYRQKKMRKKRTRQKQPS